MAADEEPTSATADAMASDPKQTGSNSDHEQQKTSQKRKASPSADEHAGEQREDVSPKRIKLDENGVSRENGPPALVGESNQIATSPGDRLNNELDSKAQAALDEKLGDRPESGLENKAEGSSDDRPHRRESRSYRPADKEGISPKELQYDDALVKLPTEPRRPVAAPEPDRRRKFNQEEKKRGQRLFGGLLSTLSQTTASSQQKKRLEIERRQQEKAQQQRVEYDKRRSEKLAQLKSIREIEQAKFNEQVKQSHSSNLVALARNLQTKSEPRIYYRPWELTKAQESIVKEQILNAEALVEKEAQELKDRKERRLQDVGATVGDLAPPEDANTRAPESSSKPNHHEKDHDESGDVLVEAEEDTVIY